MNTFKMRSVWWVIFLASVSLLAYKFIELKTQELTADRYAHDPLMLYQSAGVKGCIEDYVLKGEDGSAIQISDNDLDYSRKLIESKFGLGAEKALYVNAPKESVVTRGQPALIPLKKAGNTYCAMGIIGGFSDVILLELEAKYQQQLQ